MARFGMFALDSLKGRLVPEFGYELGWWPPPRGGAEYTLGDDGTFAALGTYNQAVHVVPGANR